LIGYFSGEFFFNNFAENTVHNKPY